MRTEAIAGRECQIGLIGCGRWGRVLLQNFRRLAPVPLVVDPRADAIAPDLQREFPGLSVVSTLDRFLEDPELSVAVIASPSETHHDLTRRCLDAGKDVFVEKPFTLSSVEARGLVTHARLRDRILMVGHKYLFHPAIAGLKAELAHRAPSVCRALVAHRLGWGATPAGIGALWHLGSHEVSIFQYLLGETAQEAAAMGVKNGEIVRVRAGRGDLRELVFEQVLVRVSDQFSLELHLDTDEANAAWVKSGDIVNIV